MAGLAALAGAAAGGDGVVTGTVLWHDRALLPAGAVLEVSLQDVSRVGAAAEVIDTQRRVDPGSPPIPFALRYDPDAIDPRHSYAVRAQVRLGGRLLMASDTHVPVITGGAPDVVEVVMVRVGGADPAAGTGLELPASFAGTMPAASGPGQDWHLDLWPDGVFYLQQTRDGQTGADIGRWEVAPERGVLVLRGGREAPVVFDILDDGALRLHEGAGTPGDATLILQAQPLQPAEVGLFLTGWLRIAPEGAVFDECLTGRSYAVSDGGDFAEALRARAALEGPAEGAPVFALLEGRLSGAGPGDFTLTIDSFGRFDPDGACPALPAASP